MARVDVALADQVKRYAALHRQPLSVVIRDALALLMEEYPAGLDPSGPHRLAAHEFLSDRYETPLDTLLEETDRAEREALMSDTNGVVIGTILSDTNRDTTYLPDTNTVAALPPLPEGQVWGKPCEKNPTHVDPQTKRTVRRRTKDKSTPTGYYDRCRACELERKAAKSQAARA
jgi:hypothetical protein